MPISLFFECIDRRLRFFSILFGLVALYILTASEAYAYENSDPRSCLEMIAASMDEANATRFSSLVDVEGIASDALADLEKLSTDPQTSQWLPPSITLMASHGALTSKALQGFLASEVREFVLYGVGSGGFGGRSVGNYRSTSMLGPLFAMASSGKKEIRGIGMPEAIRKDVYQVPFTVHDANGNNYSVEGIITGGSGSYRLTGIGNMRELILKVALEAQE